jgi:hypothetical protein
MRQGKDVGVNIFGSRVGFGIKRFIFEFIKVSKFFSTNGFFTGLGSRAGLPKPLEASES